jgi:hypothetical protein
MNRLIAKILVISIFTVSSAWAMECHLSPYIDDIDSHISDQHSDSDHSLNTHTENSCSNAALFQGLMRNPSINFDLGMSDKFIAIPANRFKSFIHTPPTHPPKV